MQHFKKQQFKKKKFIEVKVHKELTTQ